MPQEGDEGKIGSLRRLRRGEKCAPPSCLGVFVRGRDRKGGREKKEGGKGPANLNLTGEGRKSVSGPFLKFSGGGKREGWTKRKKRAGEERT